MPRKAWDLGNTTVRNPNRLQNGLKILADEFQGIISGKEAEAAFIKRLAAEGVLDTTGKQPAWFGRKWRSAFVKLGFISEKFPKRYSHLYSILKEKLHMQGVVYELTPSGKRLVDANSLGAIEDIFTRQLICLEIPSPIERKFKDVTMKPFIFLLEGL